MSRSNDPGVNVKKSDDMCSDLISYYAEYFVILPIFMVQPPLQINNSYGAGIEFRRQNLTSIDVKI